MLRSIIVIICAAFLFAVMGCSWESTPVNTERITKNRAALQKCKEDPMCYWGGFVVTQDKPESRPHIARIAPCSGISCHNGEISASLLFQFRNDGGYLNQYSEIVLYPDRKRWEELAAMHAEQFLYRRRR